MTPRAEYVERHGLIEIGRTGRGRKGEPVTVRASSTEAINLDCAACECPSVNNGSAVTGPPPQSCDCRCHEAWRLARRDA